MTEHLIPLSFVIWIGTATIIGDLLLIWKDGQSTKASWGSIASTLIVVGACGMYAAWPS